MKDTLEVRECLGSGNQHSPGRTCHYDARALHEAWPAYAVPKSFSPVTRVIRGPLYMEPSRWSKEDD